MSGADRTASESVLAGVERATALLVEHVRWSMASAVRPAPARRYSGPAIQSRRADLPRSRRHDAAAEEALGMPYSAAVRELAARTRTGAGRAPPSTRRMSGSGAPRGANAREIMPRAAAPGGLALGRRVAGGRGHQIDERGRHHAVLRPCKPREVRVRDRRAAGRRYGRVDPTRSPPRSPSDHGRRDPAREQRGRHAPACRGDRQDRPREGPEGLFLVDAVAGAAWLDRRRGAGLRHARGRGHKLDGPKGVGASISSAARILSQQRGGTQERYRRAGTGTSPGRSGWAPLELAVAERDQSARRVRKLRDRLRTAVLGVDGVELTGHPRERLPNLLSVVVGDADGASIVVKLDLQGVAGSVGSACTTGSMVPSHVLTAMGYPDDEARGSPGCRRALDDGRRDRRAIEIAPDRAARAAAAVLVRDPARAGGRVVTRRPAMSGGVLGRRRALTEAPRRRWRLMRLTTSPILCRVQEELLLAGRR